MNNLLLILALFVGSSFAEDEFPIELTCEIGDAILLLNVDSTPEKTWIKPLPIRKSPNLETGGWWRLKQYNNKKNYAQKRFKKFFKVDSDEILFGLPSGLAGTIIIVINRFTGKISTNGFNEGNCFKGFKEYKKKKF